ncbi:DUF4150 domain-containing protein [Candidatus Nitrospira salsa]
MSNEVFANGMEVACKSGDAKVIAAFPDVCLSPPSPPAGPIPVPYPDSSFSKDMKKGSKKVKIDRKEVMLKDKSFYKTSPLGDEAATKSLGAGVITHTITGKTYYVAWSMDVKFEGQNVDRHLDLTTSNHASPTATAAGPMIGAESGSGDSHKEEMCPCCKAPMHSEAQKNGEKMSASEWYNPDTSNKTPNAKEQAAIDYAKFLFEYAKESGCGNILPSEDPEDPCSAHYAAETHESQAARKQYDEEMMSPLAPRNYLIKKYGRKAAKRIRQRGRELREAKKAGAVTIAHKTALAAGGCPFGKKNTSPVSQECYDVENQLGGVQGEIAKFHRR